MLACPGHDAPDEEDAKEQGNTLCEGLELNDQYRGLNLLPILC